MTIDKMNEEEKMCLILIKEGKRTRTSLGSDPGLS